MGARPDIVLSGVKTYISYSNVADVIVVFAGTDKSVGLTHSMTAFIVAKDTPGFSVARTIDLLGHRPAPIAELHLDDCRIPKKNQLSPWNAGFTEMARFTGGRYWVGVRCLAREAFDLALEYAKTRVQGANPSSSTGWWRGSSARWRDGAGGLRPAPWTYSS